MKNNERTKHLIIPGITPVIINGERGVSVEAMSKRFITNKYIKCLYDICFYWVHGYYILDILIGHGIIKQRTDYSLEWTLNKTSLAWLFKKRNITVADDEEEEDDHKFHIPGGFWNPVGVLFSVRKETLKKLAYNESTYGGWSKDIETVKTVLEENGILL
jgi:hypothetical protein